MTDNDYASMWARTISTKLFLKYLLPSTRPEGFSWPTLVERAVADTLRDLGARGGMRPQRIQKVAPLVADVCRKCLQGLLAEAELTEETYVCSQIGPLPRVGKKGRLHE